MKKARNIGFFGLLGFLFFLSAADYFQEEVTVPIYTQSAEERFNNGDTLYWDHWYSDTVYGKMPYYGTEILNDSVSVRFYGRMIGTVEIKRKYLTKPKPIK